MGRSRHCLLEPEAPHFLTCTEPEWLPVFTRPGTVEILLEAFGSLHAVHVPHLLQGLVAKGTLVQEGQGRWSRYRLSDNEDSLHKAADFLHKAADSLHKAGDSLHKAGDSLHNSELLKRFEARQHQRLAPHEMEKIVNDSSTRWWSMACCSFVFQINPTGPIRPTARGNRKTKQ